MRNWLIRGLTVLIIRFVMRRLKRWWNRPPAHRPDSVPAAPRRFGA